MLIPMMNLSSLRYMAPLQSAFASVHQVYLLLLWLLITYCFALSPNQEACFCHY